MYSVSINPDTGVVDIVVNYDASTTQLDIDLEFSHDFDAGIGNAYLEVIDLFGIDNPFLAAAKNSIVTVCRAAYDGTNFTVDNSSCALYNQGEFYKFQDLLEDGLWQKTDKRYVRISFLLPDEFKQAGEKLKLSLKVHYC